MYHHLATTARRFCHSSAATPPHKPSWVCCGVPRFMLLRHTAAWRRSLSSGRHYWPSHQSHSVTSASRPTTLLLQANRSLSAAVPEHTSLSPCAVSPVVPPRATVTATVAGIQSHSQATVPTASTRAYCHTALVVALVATTLLQRASGSLVQPSCSRPFSTMPMKVK